jgi:hypothetical protein
MGIVQDCAVEECAGAEGEGDGEREGQQPGGDGGEHAKVDTTVGTEANHFSGEEGGANLKEAVMMAEDRAGDGAGQSGERQEAVSLV